ncbi:MAG: hypothetical protein K9H16_09560, partial [Bacteroidales bacterium]|nr:hypothetical protein [Bacteroidales bacterium]
MKNLFTLFILLLMLSMLNAQDKKSQAENLYPEDLFKYDQVLPPSQTPDHMPDCENYIMDVMFQDDSKVRIRDGELTDLLTDATAGVQNILGKLPWFEWERFSEVTEEILDQLSENGHSRTGQQVYNLNNIYRLRVPEQDNIWSLAMALESLPGIIYARPVPKPAELPVPPNYLNNQGYLDPADDVPSGIDAEYAWTRSGGTGTNIKICDLEYSWNYNHADITKAVGSQINSNVADPFNSNHHGTAVIGMLVSNSNGWGTTGATYNSSLRTCGTYYGAPTPTYNPAGAITLSIANLVAGDIILLEQQSDYTGSDGFVPIEWYGNYSPNAQTNNPVYAAIVNAVANGIHVVEAGGNGNVNTGSLTWFGNSGAVIVGAGGGFAANNLKKLNFSSYGPRFDVQGWGENVTTTGYGGLYSAEGPNYYYTSSFSGTSSASPIVTSAISCFSGYWKSNISAIPPTPANMRAILKRHGRPQVDPGDGFIGTRPNLEAMIKGYMYCTASGGCDEYISRVQLGDIDNSSDCDGYVDYTSIYSTDLPINVSQTLTVTNGTPYSADQCGVWVDWNRDGDFSDASETIAVSGNPGYGPYTATITPPATATVGDVRMRIRITYTGVISACGATTYGEVEDYTISLASAAPNYWTGAFNYYWHNAGNWSLGHIPTSTERAIVTSSGYHPPSTGTNNETIGSLEIQPGASLKVHQGQLTVNQDMDISGQLWVDYGGAVMTCYGNVNWKSGATANFQQQNVFWVHGNWEFQSGSNVQLANGIVDFIGTSTSWIRVNASNSRFKRLGTYKSSGAWARISDLSTYDLFIDDYIYIHPDAKLGISSSHDVYFFGEIIYQNGEFDFTGGFNTGTFIFDGVNQTISMNTPDGLFNNVKFSATGSVTTSGAFDVAGNLTIESGNFNPLGNVITVTGNWQTNVGPNGFVESGSRIIFNGPGHQYIYGDENFNILEVNNGAALRINSSAYDVSCNTYDWTSGGIDVVAGNFNILDLADNGLYGTYWCNNNGTLTITQDGAQYTDLNGEIHIFGGTMTVNGGLGSSYWPYANDALIVMTGGVLNFADNAIRLNTSTYTFTSDIQGGTIRSQWGFWDYRGDFNPSGGTLEFYGNANANIFLTLGSNLYDLRINKIAAENSAPLTQNEFIQYRDGTKEPVTRANMVTATSDLLILNDFTLDGGTFTAPSLMQIGGDDGGDWINNVGPDAFVEGTGKVSFIGQWQQQCSSEVFNVLELNKPNGDLEFPNGTDVECQTFQWLSGEMRIYDATFTAWDLFDNGIYGKYFLSDENALVNLYQDDFQWIDLNGRIRIDAGTMNIYGGSGSSFWPYQANAQLWLYGGVLNFADKGIYINGSSAFTLDTDITAGVIKTAGGFYGNGDEFQPTGGIVELYGPDDASVGIDGLSYFMNLHINKEPVDMPVGNYKAIPSKGQTDAPQRIEPEIQKSRSNIAAALTNFKVENSMIIENGIFDVRTYDVVIDLNLDISGTLKMMDVAGSLTTYLINWLDGSEDIIDAGNIFCYYWNFYEGTLAHLGTGNLAHVYSGFNFLDEAGEIGNILMGEPGSKFTFNENRGSALNTAGYATLLSGSDWFFNVPINIGTDFTVEDGATFSINDNLTVENDLNLQGEIIFNGDLMLVHGGISWPSTGSLTINGGDVIFDAPNHPDKGWEYIYGYLEMADGLFEITYNSINFENSATTNISGGILRTGGAFAAIDPGVFEPTGGAVEIIGEELDELIYCFNGNYFYNLIINRAPDRPCHIAYGDPVFIQKDLTIQNGVLNTGSSNLFVGRNWTNNVGPEGFIENANLVTFTGTFQGSILTDETFYNLNIDKSWAGNNDVVIADGSTIGVLNDLNVQFGGLQVGSGSILDIDKNIALWNNGLLYVQDFTSADIFVGGNWDNQNTANNNTKGFYPGHSTVTFDGAINQEHNSAAAIQNFYNMIINNSDEYLMLGSFTQFFGDVQVIDGAFWDNSNTYFHYFHGDVTVEPDGAFLPNSMISFIGANDAVFLDNSTGSSYLDNDVWIEKDASSTTLQLESRMKIFADANLHVFSGTLNLNGNYVRCVGNVNIYEDGTVNIDSGAWLEVGRDKTLSVQNGGVLEVLGSSGAPAMITVWNSSLGYKYFFNVESGGTISADNAVFEHMKGPNGVNIQNGALIDPVNCFNNSEFRNGDGTAGSSLLTINNNQILTISEASFPITSATYNVAKSMNQGHITFEDYTGAFAGEDHDFDPNNLIDWYVPTLEVYPPSRNVSASAGSTTFGITSNLNWTVSESVAWFSVSPVSGNGNGTITVNYQQNTSLIARTGQITISAPEAPAVVVTVNQAGANAILSVTPSNRDVAPTAGNTTFSISANTGWTVSESVAWFSVSPATGNGNGILTVNYGENATGASRIGNITVTATGGSPTQTVTVSQESYPTHLVSLPEGWSGLSSYIMPVNNDIGDVFDPISGNFEIAATMSGMYYPAGPVNTIGDWLSQSAYKVKMSSQAVLPIIGNEETNKTFALNSGWNLVPVICNAPVNVVTLFSGTNLKILKDVAGLGIYWPEFGINTIGDVLPG